MNLKHKLFNGIKRIVQITKEEKIVPIPQPVNEAKLLKGKTALISGGSSGIGMACAEAFARHGANVIIAGRKESALKDALQKLGGVTGTSF